MWKYFALTFNVCEHEVVNRKRWIDYTPEAQRGIILRKMRAFFRVRKGLIWSENNIYWEICPQSGCQHLHTWFLASMDEQVVDDESDIIEYLFNSRFRTQRYKTVCVRPLETQEDISEWEKYCKKEISE